MRITLQRIQKELELGSCNRADAAVEGGDEITATAGNELDETLIRNVKTIYGEVVWP
ncbi:MAG: hypothetical protein RLZZ20_439 [Pseudomonadota bacterium]